jgi:hypothetical protein
MDETLTRILAVLSTTPQRWITLAQFLPANMLSEPPVPGEWSAAECLQHIIDTEHIFRSRLQAFHEGRDFPAFNPDSEGTKLESPSTADLAREFARLRDENLRDLAQLTPADYALAAHHSELGPVTLSQMINEWAAHDLNHTVQAERAMMQPFLRACGPWRIYFTDHIAGG